MTNTLFLVRREIKINLPLHDANSGFIFGPLSTVLSVDLFSEHHMYENAIRILDWQNIGTKKSIGKLLEVRFWISFTLIPKKMAGFLALKKCCLFF